jgi:predicted PurR-regulated permease PerM
MQDDDAAMSARPGVGGFAIRVAAAVGLVALAWLAWQLRHTILLGFAAVVAGTVLVAAARPIRRLTGCAWVVAVTLAAVGIVAVLALVGWFIWPQLQIQGQELVQTIPDAIRSIEDRLNISVEREDFSSSFLQGLAARVTSWSAALAGALTSLVLVLITGGFLAAAPARYRDGLIRLFPPRARPRLRRALDRAGHGLGAWLLAQLAAMSIVGVCVAAGT